MMWGFGDQVEEVGGSLPETVQAVEDCTMLFIRSVVRIHRTAVAQAPCAGAGCNAEGRRPAQGDS